MKFELEPNNRNASDDELIEDLQITSKKLGKVDITREEYDKHGRYSEGTLRKRFGNWIKALQMAGLSSTRTYCSDEDLLNELRRISNLDGITYISKTIFNQNKIIGNTSTIERRFGSWARALELAGIKILPKQSRYSEIELFENIYKVWTHYGRQPTTTEINEFPSCISSNTYLNRFKTYRKALEAFIEYINEDQSPKKNEDAEKLLNDADGQKPKKHITSRTINLRL